MNPRLTVIDIASSHGAQPLCDAVYTCLSQREKSLPCRFFYDQAGSELFERITELPEYYLTRCEAEILRECADAIVEAVGSPLCIVEFGSGSSVKTRLLLEAALRGQDTLTYVPIDISRDFLIQASEKLLDEYPKLAVSPICAEYLDAIPHLPETSEPRLFLFLGSNIGNFAEPEAVAFLEAVRKVMRPQDRMLLGADLVKRHDLLEAAYADSAGVTAEFNLNLLRRLNRDLNAGFDLSKFEHQARYAPDDSRIEMRLVSKDRQQVYVESLDTTFQFEPGESIVTEYSHKYTVEGLGRLARRADLAVDAIWSDDEEFFGEFLLAPLAANRDADRKNELGARLGEVRTLTLRLLTNVPDEFLRTRVHEFYSPIGWHFGHVGRTEEYWVCRALGLQPMDPELSFIYADLADNPKDNRVNVPDRAGLLDYLARTRGFVLEKLQSASLTADNPYLEDGYAWEFAVQHECQHHETIAEMLHLIQLKRSVELPEPLDWKPGPRSRNIEHPTGEFQMGSDNLHGYDNEKRAHLTQVPSFQLSEYPVTCYEWSEFMARGGYEDPSFWTEEGWAWKQNSNARRPFYWLDECEGHFQFGAFGVRALDPSEPVMGVSHHEAVAYARFRNARLPTETEWEYASAAAGSESRRMFAWGDEPPDEELAAQAMNRWSPQPVGTSKGRTPLGVADLSGNVWEWTQSPFLPYPGFEPFPYDGYSKDHMRGEHFVCRGGSWATSPIILRNTFRNWYVPGYRQGFLGVRLAYS